MLDKNLKIFGTINADYNHTIPVSFVFSQAKPEQSDEN